MAETEIRAKGIEPATSTLRGYFRRCRSCRNERRSDSFNAVFRKTQAPRQFALHISEEN